MKTWMYTAEVMWLLLTAFSAWIDVVPVVEETEVHSLDDFMDETSARSFCASDHQIRPPPLGRGRKRFVR